MRARMGLLMARQEVMLRAIVTKDKPEEMLEISPKGTVPVLLLADGVVIDESLDIMLWALKTSDPTNLLNSDYPESLPEMLSLIKIYDFDFRPILSNYKQAKRYHKADEVELRSQCEVYIQDLETRLEKHKFIMGEQLSLVDFAILPFIRQFANTNKKWFRETNYPNLTQWLANQLQSILYTKTMRKFPMWTESREEFLFAWDSL